MYQLTFWLRNFFSKRPALLEETVDGFSKHWQFVRNGHVGWNRSELLQDDDICSYKTWLLSSPAKQSGWTLNRFTKVRLGHCSFWQSSNLKDFEQIKENEDCSDSTGFSGEHLLPAENFLEYSAGSTCQLLALPLRGSAERSQCLDCTGTVHLNILL